MSHPDLPPTVKAMLASEGHRVHHHLWHFVRSEEDWNGLSQADKDGLTADGWAAPRFNCQSALNRDPQSASKRDPFEGHSGERPTGWSWSGLRSPVGRA